MASPNWKTEKVEMLKQSLKKIRKQPIDKEDKSQTNRDAEEST